ncbi:hypothetical protein chiPu_0015452 [Chiloscyllium punctatum]|uniref:Uncharacterized protein n=1 Tax=Chiloscyllium punctatum TaxID=137246 RepID=A0A401T2T4_CHIPU|nr:hypothetical protein [Chiloscyllium punctatum]
MRLPSNRAARAYVTARATFGVMRLPSNRRNSALRTLDIPQGSTVGQDVDVLGLSDCETDTTVRLNFLHPLGYVVPPYIRR